MAKIRTKVSLRHWQNTSYAMQKCMREGNMEEARKYANTLLLYLREMGLAQDELDRQVPSDSMRHRTNGIPGKAKAKMTTAS